MRELLQEFVHEITGEPTIFAAEVVQFILLLVIIRMLLRRTVGRSLRERRERIAAQVEEANRAGDRYAQAESQAAAIVTEARRKADQIREHAGNAAEENRRSGLERIERDAAAVTLQARQTVDAEKARVVSKTAEQLIALIGQVARRYLEDALTESERRAVMQKLLLARLKEMENPPAQRGDESS
jgi:F-type H+-transporting ATPase subunit b